MTTREAWEQFILALLAMASQFATPLGVRILDVSRDNLRISRDVLHIRRVGIRPGIQRSHLTRSKSTGSCFSAR